MTVVKVLKRRPLFKGKQKVSLPTAVPDCDGKTFVLFAEVVKGRLDFYYGVPTNTDAAEFERYLCGAVKVMKEGPEKRLGFAFPYLNNPNEAIAADAVLTFAKAELADLRAAGKVYDRAKLLQWLRDKETPPYRVSLFAVLLGACGKAEDKPLFREPLLQAETADGFVLGYYFLDPPEGKEAALRMLTDGKLSFPRRHATLRTIRFILGESTPQDLETLAKRLVLTFDQEDMADLIVEVLRTYKIWGPTEEVLRLYTKQEKTPILVRALARYALQSPDPKAKAFVAELRKKEPERVADVEELLQLENPQPGKSP